MGARALLVGGGVLLALIGSAVSVEARQRVQGFCENGDQQVTVAGVSSSTLVQRSYVLTAPAQGCTVTVYPTGAAQIPANLALIYADDIGTPKANPFTATSDGQWFFYADTGRYDVRFSNAGIATPFTRGDWPTGGMLNVYTANGLPLPSRQGALNRQSDGTRGLVLDTGTQWVSLLGNVTNVQDFDAHGNGIADDTTAIQNAVNAQTSGGVVFLPCGSYKITAAIALRANVWVRGSGPCSILQVSGGVHGLTATGTATNPLSYIAVTDLALQKIAGSSISNIGIFGLWTNDLRIDHVVVTNNGGVWGTAFACTDCNRTRIVDASATGTGSNVIALNTGSGALSTTSGIQNAVIRGTYQTNFQGIDFNSQTDCLADGVVASGNTSTFAYGIVVEGGTQRCTIVNTNLFGHNFGALDFEPLGTYYEVLVANNTFRTSPTCVNLQVSGGMFTGNTFDGCTIAGLVSTGGQGGVFIGNQFRSNAIGMSLNTSFRNTVIGNYFVNSTTYGVQFGGGAPSTTFLAGNIFTSSGTADYNTITTGVALVDQTPANLRGSAVITGAATTAAVAGLGMPDTNYQVVASVEATAGGPAAGSTRVYVTSKSTTGFTINTEVAPGGVASVTVGYHILR